MKDKEEQKDMEKNEIEKSDRSVNETKNRRKTHFKMLHFRIEMSWTGRVEKATNELLAAPDWPLNLSICDSVNTYHWLAKEYIKAIKKRLKNRNPKVQILAMTLLETMVKNCGDCVHIQISERAVLRRMLKIIRRHMNSNARDKALILIETWKEAFGGSSKGKFPHYYWAYEELKRAGVQFPPRSKDESPIFTPPARHPALEYSESGSTPSMDNATTSETVENISLSKMDSMRTVMELLADMLHAMNPKDREAIKNEVVVELVTECRSNQEKLAKFLTTTGDEELLGSGLQLNDSLQSLLAKHDAIASGKPMPVDFKTSSLRPTEVRNSSPRSTDVKESNFMPTEAKESNLRSEATSSALITNNLLEEEEEEDEELVQLLPRRVKDGRCSKCNCDKGPAIEATSTPSNALVLTSPTTPDKEQDLIDLLSMTLTTSSISSSSSDSSPRTPLTPSSPCTQIVHQIPVTPTTPGYLPGSQPYLENQVQVSYSSYVVPWVQPQSYPQLQSPQYGSTCTSSPWPMAQVNTSQNPFEFAVTTPNTSLTPYPNVSASYMPMPTSGPLQYLNAFPSAGNNASTMYGEAPAALVMKNANPAIAQKSYVPSYKLFEDLDVIGIADRRLSTTSTAANSMSNHAMVGGRK